VDPDQPVYRVAPMEAVVVGALGQRRFAALLLMVFAGLSLALAAVGVYGLVSQSVAQRRREIGVRMAVGADSGAILTLIVRDAVVLAALGAVVGLALSLVLMRFLSSQLFECRHASRSCWRSSRRCSSSSRQLRPGRPDEPQLPQSNCRAEI